MSSGGPLRELVGTFTNLLDVPAVSGVVLNARDVTEQRAHDARSSSRHATTR